MFAGLNAKYFSAIKDFIYLILYQIIDDRAITYSPEEEHICQDESHLSSYEISTEIEPDSFAKCFNGPLGTTIHIICNVTL